MYEAFFQLTEHPFIYEPLATSYFPTGSIEDARTRLIRSIERRQGPGLVIGGAGTGKSLLCAVLAGHFNTKLRVVHLACGRVATRRALFQAILYELSLPYRGLEEGELRIALLDRLSSDEKMPHGVLLLVDEAHTLPVQLLEEIRLLTNLVRDGRSRVQLVLAGLPLLDELFAGPRLASFNQRLATRCYLGHLDRDETAKYVRAHLQRVSEDPGIVSLFTDDALSAIHAATDGIPRLINQLCEHALVLASVGGVRRIDHTGIDEAWADLQQLPTPSRASATADGCDESERIIEFGSLRDPLDDTATSSEDMRTAGSGTGRGEWPAAPSTEPPDGWRPVSGPVRTSSELDPLGIRSTESRPTGKEVLPADNEDFQPIGSIGPETECAFTFEADPFAETFDEEVVVLDRYGCFEENVLNQATRLDSGEELTDEEDTERGIVKLNRSQDEHLHEVLVIEDDESHVPPEDGIDDAGPERKNYRQLFSKLRRG
jgi:type II secretory pathway predicted ATPase ExeA